MAEAARPPDCISLAEHRDNRHPLERALRWGVVTGLTALALAGVANVFGQRDSETLATGDGGTTLALTAPAALRSGPLFQGTFRIHAEREIEKPTLVLDERLRLDEVAAAARLQSIGSLDEVEWAIVEGGGQISFIPKRPDR